MIFTSSRASSKFSFYLVWRKRIPKKSVLVAVANEVSRGGSRRGPGPVLSPKTPAALGHGLAQALGLSCSCAVTSTAVQVHVSDAITCLKTTVKTMRAVKGTKAEKGKLGSSEIITDELKRRDVDSPVA